MESTREEYRSPVEDENGKAKAQKIAIYVFGAILSLTIFGLIIYFGIYKPVTRIQSKVDTAKTALKGLATVRRLAGEFHSSFFAPSASATSGPGFLSRVATCRVQFTPRERADTAEEEADVVESCSDGPVVVRQAIGVLRERLTGKNNKSELEYTSSTTNGRGEKERREVVYADDDYGRVVLGTPDKQKLWVLTKKRETNITDLLKRAAEKGYAVR